MGEGLWTWSCLGVLVLTVAKLPRLLHNDLSDPLLVCLLMWWCCTPPPPLPFPSLLPASSSPPLFPAEAGSSVNTGEDCVFMEYE